MIISVNPEPTNNEFKELISATLTELDAQSKKSAKCIKSLAGRAFEPYIKDIMSNLAIGTSFENSIELIGGQKFPDIVAKKFYGIEVKTTKQNQWRTTGNSVLETTRVDGVERIFMLFAKLHNPIEFKCRPYEDVLSEVVVTHSPRYLIDMNLKKGTTIFDKIGKSYEQLRKEDSPIKPIVRYYKQQLKPGEELWWIDADKDTTKASNNFVIQLWTNLDSSYKKRLRNQALVYFPEIFGNSPEKYGRLALWLITKKSIVCPNVRDSFTAGGQKNYKIGNEKIYNVPRVFINMLQNITDIIDIINKTSSDELSGYWNIYTTDSQKVSHWVELIDKEAFKINTASHLKIKEILTSVIYNECGLSI
ncbi:MAG: hypothetical protein GX801_09670 [Fibrobacter sp.]|nr:hypothetical protein [Fibrobacter sp.]